MKIMLVDESPERSLYLRMTLERLGHTIVGDVKGELVVASPVYKQHFNLATRQCVEDASVSVGVFSARVVNDIVEIEA
mgnify:CR=1 FL=1